MPTDQVQQYDLSNLEWRVKNDMRQEMRDEVRRLRREIQRVESALFYAIMVVLFVAIILAPLFFTTLDTVKTLAEAAAS